MKTIIYYYTGTGNSLWTSRCIAAELGNTTLSPMSFMSDGAIVADDVEAVGLVFPVHMWGVPRLVLDFLDNVELPPDRYYFSCAVNAGQVARTLIQLKKHMACIGLRLSVGGDIVLPSNYIPWGGPGPAAKREKLFTAAREKIAAMAPSIAARQTKPVEKGPLWQRIVFTPLYKLTFNLIPKMDKDFWVDDKCNGCGVCEKICPVNNVVIPSGKPEWLHRCEQCLACLQWCPQEAIQYGKKTPLYERYHHPEIQLKEVLRDYQAKANL